VRRIPLAGQHQPGDDDDQAGDADQPPASRMLHGLGRHVLLPVRLTAVRAGDHRKGQVGKERVDDRPAHRLEAGPGAASFPGDAERGLAQAPQRVAHEPDAEHPQQHRAQRLAREQPQGALLAGFLPGLAERDQRRDAADQYPDKAPGGEPGPGQHACGRAAGRLPAPDLHASGRS
jgi:hypothetical protein